jgi:hypothetical protein
MSKLSLVYREYCKPCFKKYKILTVPCINILQCIIPREQQLSTGNDTKTNGNTYVGPIHSCQFQVT